MHCAGAVKKALNAVEGAGNAQVDLEKNTATVDVADSVADKALYAVVEEEGYAVVEIIQAH